MGVYLLLSVKLDEKCDVYTACRKFINCFNEPGVTSVSIYDYYHKQIEEVKGKLVDGEVQHLSLEKIGDILRKYENWGQIILWGNFFDGNITVYNMEYPKFLWSASVKSVYDRLVDDQPLQKEFFAMLKRIVNILNPGVISLYAETSDDWISNWFEYHKDPYSFCTDNVLEDTYPIKHVIPERELISLIEKYSDDGIIKGKEGIGVIRNPGGKADPGSYGSYVYPRYFIRRELRKRGLKLKPGKTEEMIKDGIVSRPDIMREIGIIDEGIYERIVEAKSKMIPKKSIDFEELKEKEREVIEKTLSKKELEELGLE